VQVAQGRSLRPYWLIPELQRRDAEARAMVRRLLLSASIHHAEAALDLAGSEEAKAILRARILRASEIVELDS